MPEFDLVVPFLTDSLDFARGVEFGMLYAEMRAEVWEIKGYYLLENQEQILLAAKRLGWRVTELATWRESWFYLRMERTA